MSNFLPNNPAKDNINTMLTVSTDQNSILTFDPKKSNQENGFLYLEDGKNYLVLSKTVPYSLLPNVTPTPTPTITPSPTPTSIP